MAADLMMGGTDGLTALTGKALAKRFGIDGDTTSTSSSELPYIAFIPRGSSLEDHDGGDGGFTRARAVRDSDELRAWVWGQVGEQHALLPASSSSSTTQAVVVVVVLHLTGCLPLPPSLPLFRS